MSAKKTLTVTIEENTAATTKAEKLNRQIGWLRDASKNPDGFEAEDGKVYSQAEIAAHLSLLVSDPQNKSVLAAAIAAKKRTKKITVEIDRELAGKLDKIAEIKGITRDAMVLNLLAEKLQRKKRAA